MEQVSIHTKIQRIKRHKDLRTQSEFRKLKRVQKVGQSSESEKKFRRLDRVQKVVHDEHQEPSPEIHEPNEEHARFM